MVFLGFRCPLAAHLGLEAPERLQNTPSQLCHGAQFKRVIHLFTINIWQSCRLCGLEINNTRRASGVEIENNLLNKMN